jgi:hypothetical protein
MKDRFLSSSTVKCRANKLAADLAVTEAGDEVRSLLCKGLPRAKACSEETKDLPSPRF